MQRRQQIERRPLSPAPGHGVALLWQWGVGSRFCRCRTLAFCQVDQTSTRPSTHPSTAARFASRTTLISKRPSVFRHRWGSSIAEWRAAGRGALCRSVCTTFEPL